MSLANQASFNSNERAYTVSSSSSGRAGIEQAVECVRSFTSLGGQYLGVLEETLMQLGSRVRDLVILDMHRLWRNSPVLSSIMGLRTFL